MPGLGKGAFARSKVVTCDHSCSERFYFPFCSGERAKVSPDTSSWRSHRYGDILFPVISPYFPRERVLSTSGTTKNAITPNRAFRRSPVFAFPSSSRSCRRLERAKLRGYNPEHVVSMKPSVTLYCVLRILLCTGPSYTKLATNYRTLFFSLSLSLEKLETRLTGGSNFGQRNRAAPSNAPSV